MHAHKAINGFFSLPKVDYALYCSHDSPTAFCMYGEPIYQGRSHKFFEHLLCSHVENELMYIIGRMTGLNLQCVHHLSV
jgi:hypothetical protein